MIRALLLVGCVLLQVDGRKQHGDWTPTMRTIEYGLDNASSIPYDELSEAFFLEDPPMENLDQFIPSDFESKTMRSASDILYEHVDYILQGPLDTVKEINDVGFKGITSGVHENISYLYVKLFTYFIRGYAFMSRSLLRSFKAIGGNTCYQLPDIEKFFKIFTLKTGELCPFDDFEMQNVTVTKSPQKWIVELPVVLREVKVVFSSVQLYTPLLSTPAWTFTAKNVLVKITMGMSKALVPYPVSLDMQVKVEGCDITDPDSNWIIRKMMKLSSKICDPILNEIIRVSLFVARMDLKILRWFAKMVFNGDMWLYTVVEWVLKELQKLLQPRENYIM